MIPTTVNEPALHHGDCVEVLARYPENTLDAGVDDPPAGIAFMGSRNRWDAKRGYQAKTNRGREVGPLLAALGLAGWEAGFVTFMVDCNVALLRVLKPGAYSLSWALPRTSDLAGLALRLAGFEVKDSLVHLFGQGMVKSLDISKAIDKMHGAERKTVGAYVRPDGRPRNCDNWEPHDGSQTHGDMGTGRVRSTPATDDAKRWDGTGTAVSPSHENWLLARKPTRLTYAANVLEHGCGGLHVEACRVPTAVAERRGREAAATGGSGLGRGDVYGDGEAQTYRMGAGGRWPPNVLLSGDEVCEELDRQSGHQRSGVAVKRNGVRNDNPVAFASALPRGTADQGFGDSGGASRFFPRFRYQAKASDRRAGLQHGRNLHSTHKHPDLMRWLMRLVTPTAKQTGDLPGLVVSRFLGSGTDGVAAVAERFRFVGIEQDPEHFAVARARIMAAIGSPEVAAELNEDAPKGAQLNLL